MIMAFPRSFPLHTYLIQVAIERTYQAIFLKRRKETEENALVNVQQTRRRGELRRLPADPVFISANIGQRRQ